MWGAANSNERTNQKQQMASNFTKWHWLEMAEEGTVHIKTCKATK